MSKYDKILITKITENKKFEKQTTKKSLNILKNKADERSAQSPKSIKEFTKFDKLLSYNKKSPSKVENNFKKVVMKTIDIKKSPSKISIYKNFSPKRTETHDKSTPEPIKEQKGNNINVVINMNKYVINQNGYKSKRNLKNSYDLSTIFINDEHSTDCMFDMITDDVKLIDKVRLKIVNIKSHIYPLKKMILLKPKAFYNLMLYCSSFYEELYNSNCLVGRKMDVVMKSGFVKLVNEFKDMYRNDFEVYDFRLVSYKNNINLIIRSKILTNKYTTLSFGLNMKYYKRDPIMQSWRLDVKSRSDISFWITSEAMLERNQYSMLSYTQPIMQVAKNDFTIIKIPVFNNFGIVDHTYSNWNSMKYLKTPRSVIDMEKTNARANLLIDPLRSSEIELYVHLWADVKTLDESYLMEEVNIIFGDNFKILQFNFDISNFYLFKIKMQASKYGIIPRNKFIGFNIIIKNENDYVVNETNSLHIMNTVSQNYEIRINDIIYFYLKDMF